MNFQRYVAKISGCKISDREFYRLKATMKDFGLDTTKENFLTIGQLKKLSYRHKISLSKCLSFYLVYSSKLPCKLSKKDLIAICSQIAPKASLASLYRWCENVDKKSVSIAILMAFNYQLNQRKKLK
jgi:hypothetical protein